MAITLTSDITITLIQAMGGDNMVVAAAKVSTSGEDAVTYVDGEANFGLINYLMKHRHGTPFEHSAMTVFVHAPAFVWWEWIRHRIGMSYNLESGRYKKLDPLFWVPRTTRPILKADDFKAARPKLVQADDKIDSEVVYCMNYAYATAWDEYEHMIKLGVANEVARAVLPFAIYYSGWVTTNPRALMHFLSLRTNDSSATFRSYPQAEIEEAARACEQLLAEGWPLTYKAWHENGRVAP